ncbi:MAG: ATP-binding protein [Actinomycetota bacterium]|nr:ATP-binding protein [Actinomycetota bacterium]
MVNGRKWREESRGVALAAVSFLIVSSVMFFFRAHISVATAALVLVIPVILGVMIGGFSVGLIGIVLGFIIYDFVFIPPYYTLSVGQTQNWIALGVFVVVVILVSRVVASLKDARSLAIEREHNARRLFELSKLLLGEKELPELLETVANSVQLTFGFEAVVLLLQGPEKLEVGASAGQLFSSEELSQLIPEIGAPATLYRTSEDGAQTLFSLALSAAGRPMGLLVMRGSHAQSPDAQLLSTFANHAALAIEQAQLKQQALQAKLLEETDRWRRALLGSVSHDLRTPLASIKTAASSLSDLSADLDPNQRLELLDTISVQTDRLTRLVVNLLDMSRIEAGVLTPRPSTVEVAELIEEGIDALGDDQARQQIQVRSCPHEIFVSADHILISQVIANLLENAVRYSPKEKPITIDVSSTSSKVLLSVSDWGPGVPADQRERVFDLFHKDSESGHTGLGLSIAKAFVSAHGEDITLTNSESGGAQFTFSLPLVPIDEYGYIDDQAAPDR